MSFDLTPTAAQHDLARRAHEFAEHCVRPVAADYDARQEFPWPVLEEAAERGFVAERPAIGAHTLALAVCGDVAAECGIARRRTGWLAG